MRTSSLLAVSAAIVTLFGSFAIINPTVQAQTGISPQSVSSNSSAVSISRSEFGVNVATWDYQMLDSSTVPAIRTLGTGVQQFPNDGDLWNWKTDVSRSSNSPNSPWDNFKEPVSLDKWGQILRSTNNTGLYIVDYGTNSDWTGGATAQDAAEVTKYIVEHHIPVTAMVIGSEAYGDWRINLHKDKSPQEYAKVAKQMAIAIHAIAPNIKVGVDLICPSPEGNDVKDLYWNQVVLKEDAPYIQFVSLHSYVSDRLQSNSGLLQYLSVIPTIMQEVHSEMNQIVPKYSNGIETWITELNPYQMGTPAQSIAPVYGAALTESILLYRAYGADQIDWWSLHGGAHPILPDGSLSDAVATKPGTPYGTNGLLADGQGPEPAVNVPYPAAKAYSQVMKAIHGTSNLQVHVDPTWFIARITNGQNSTWFLINKTNAAKTYSLNGKKVLVGAASMKSLALTNVPWPYNAPLHPTTLTRSGVTDNMLASPVSVGSDQQIGVLPSISAVNSEVYAGTVVKVTGTGFGNVQGNGYLQLKDGTTSWGSPTNAAHLRILSWSNNSIEFIAPYAQGDFALIPGTRATLQMVTNGLAVSNVTKLKVVSSPRPVISGVSHSTIHQGDEVTIKGDNFGSQQGYVHLADAGVNWGMVGNQAAFNVLSWSNTQIKFEAPLPSGPYKLSPSTVASLTIINANNQISNSIALSVK